MQSWIIGLIILVTFIYIIKLWFEYKKVAVQTKTYAKTVALRYLFVGLIACVGVFSLSSEMTKYLFSLVGMVPPQHFQWKALAVYCVFVVATVMIVRNKTKSIVQKNTYGDNIAGDKITNVREN